VSTSPRGSATIEGSAHHLGAEVGQLGGPAGGGQGGAPQVPIPCAFVPMLDPTDQAVLQATRLIVGPERCGQHCVDDGRRLYRPR
jgi:hypothetical protein